MRLLIVEDDPELREGLSALLQQSGYEVEAHADGRVAFNTLSSKEYDLAIVDLMVPGMSGLTLVRNLRKQLSTLPILIITARDALEDRVSGLDAGPMTISSSHSRCPSSKRVCGPCCAGSVPTVKARSAWAH